MAAAKSNERLPVVLRAHAAPPIDEEEGVMRTTIAAAIAALAAWSASASASATLPGPYMGCVATGFSAGEPGAHGLRTRPSRCNWSPYHGFGYNTGKFRSIRWSSWSSQAASASATSYGTQTGVTYRVPVKLRLSRPVTCYGSFRLFSRLTVTSKYGTGPMARMRCSDVVDQ
jgi:hypothetical protein